MSSLRFFFSWAPRREPGAFSVLDLCDASNLRYCGIAVENWVWGSNEGFEGSSRAVADHTDVRLVILVISLPY